MAAGADLRAALRSAVDKQDVDNVKQILLSSGNLVDEALYEGGRTALHVASERGDVEMCRVLLEHGADMERKAGREKLTPFMMAADEGHVPILQLLVNAGCDVHAKDRINDGPLAMASRFGRLEAVQYLIANGLSVNEKHKYGWTALHNAALNGHDSIIQCLLLNSATVDAVDGIGYTPLHNAALHGHDGIVGILLDHKTNPDIATKEGNTPLHNASLHGHDGTVGILLDHKANPDIANEEGDTPLHNAALHGHDGTVGILLEHKTNPDIANKDGKKPFDVTFSSFHGVRRQLKKAMDEKKFAVLYATGTVKPSVMKLCVIGAAGSGKTTLLEAVQRTFFKYLFTRENQRDDPTCEYERTMGINVITVDIPGVGRVSMWEYAGQDQFHKSHGVFFSGSNSFFILLISLVTGEKRRQRTLEKLMDEAHYWLSFLRASLHGHFIPTVMMAASHGDCCPDGQRLLEQVASHMRDLFHGKINITEECSLLDCRKSRSTEMQQLKHFLKKVRDSFMKSDVRYPRLCELVTSKLLPALRKKEEDPFMETDELVNVIEKEMCPGQDKKILDTVVDFLDSEGEVIRVDNVVSINPLSLSQYAIGPIMAPNTMKWHAKAPNGRMTKEEAERAIHQYLRDKRIRIRLNIDTILKILVDLGFCFKLEDGSYMFPAHLPLKELSQMWQREEAKYKVYVGRRCVCSTPTSIFSPPTFCFFQCQACIKLDIESELWRDGIIVARAVSFHVQCLVVIERLRAVEFVARGGEGSESECLSLLDDVMAVWNDVVDQHSPGTEFKMEYLSKQHLMEHREQPAAYSEEKIEAAKQKGPTALITHDITLSERLNELLVFPPLPACPVTDSAVIQAVVTYGSEQWYSFGLKLGFNNNEINCITHNKPAMKDKLQALFQVKADEMSDIKALESLALRICSTVPSPIIGDVAEELAERRDNRV